MDKSEKAFEMHIESRAEAAQAIQDVDSKKHSMRRSAWDWFFMGFGAFFILTGTGLGLIQFFYYVQSHEIAFESLLLLLLTLPLPLVLLGILPLLGGIFRPRLARLLPAHSVWAWFWLVLSGILFLAGVYTILLMVWYIFIFKPISERAAYLPFLLIPLPLVLLSVSSLEIGVSHVDRARKRIENHLWSGWTWLWLILGSALFISGLWIFLITFAILVITPGWVNYLQKFFLAEIQCSLPMLIPGVILLLIGISRYRRARKLSLPS